MDTENYKLLEALALKDVEVLKEKGKHYGDSWRKRGGVGAFMMLARKWDRIENMAIAKGYDVFDAERDGVLEDIADLRRYLLLVEGHMLDRAAKNGGASRAHYGAADVAKEALKPENQRIVPGRERPPAPKEVGGIGGVNYGITDGNNGA